MRVASLTLYWQPTATFMREFMSRHELYLDALHAQEWDARTMTPCSCPEQQPRLFRCTECSQHAPCCAACFTSSHRNLPFHRVETWTGSYFARHSLYAMGFELFLGHGGSRCPNASKSTTMTVVHTNGIHKLSIVFCACAPLTKRPLQLLAAAMYPATWDYPETAFTIPLLKHYHLESLQSRTSAHDYWAVLRRLTDNTRAEGTPVRFHMHCEAVHSPTTRTATKS